MIALYSHVWLIWTMLHRHFTSNSSFKYQPTPSAAKKILKIVCAAIEAFLGFWLPSNSMHGLFKRFCMGVIHEIPVLTPFSFTLLPPKSNIFFKFFLKKSSNSILFWMNSACLNTSWLDSMIKIHIFSIRFPGWGWELWSQKKKLFFSTKWKNKLSIFLTSGFSYANLTLCSPQPSA